VRVLLRRAGVVLSGVVFAEPGVVLAGAVLAGARSGVVLAGPESICNIKVTRRDTIK